MLGNLGGDRFLTIVFRVLAAFIAKTGSETIPTACWKWVSTECQRLLDLHLLLYEWHWITSMHNGGDDSLYRQICTGYSWHILRDNTNLFHLDLPLSILEPFSIQKQSKRCIWTIMATSHCHSPRWNTNNHWHSIDADFQHAAGSDSLSLLPVEAANDLFMIDGNLLHLVLPEIHDQKSLTFHWHSFSSWGRQGIAFGFAYKGSQ